MVSPWMCVLCLCMLCSMSRIAGGLLSYTHQGIGVCNGRSFTDEKNSKSTFYSGFDYNPVKTHLTSLPYPMSILCFLLILACPQIKCNSCFCSAANCIETPKIKNSVLENLLDSCKQRLQNFKKRLYPLTIHKTAEIISLILQKGHQSPTSEWITDTTPSITYHQSPLVTVACTVFSMLALPCL